MSIMGYWRGSQKPRSALAVVGLAVAVAMAGGLTSCKVHVDQGPNGEDKKVQVDTPFGGVHVNTDQTSAADLGLPVYPARRSRTTIKRTSPPMYTWASVTGNCGCRW